MGVEDEKKADEKLEPIESAEVTAGGIKHASDKARQSVSDETLITARESAKRETLKKETTDKLTSEPENKKKIKANDKFNQIADEYENQLREKSDDPDIKSGKKPVKLDGISALIVMILRFYGKFMGQMEYYSPSAFTEKVKKNPESFKKEEINKIVTIINQPPEEPSEEQKTQLERELSEYDIDKASTLFVCRYLKIPEKSSSEALASSFLNIKNNEEDYYYTDNVTVENLRGMSPNIPKGTMIFFQRGPNERMVATSTGNGKEFVYFDSDGFGTDGKNPGKSKETGVKKFELDGPGFPKGLSLKMILTPYNQNFQLKENAPEKNGEGNDPEKKNYIESQTEKQLIFNQIGLLNTNLDNQLKTLGLNEKIKQLTMKSPSELEESLKTMSGQIFQSLPLLMENLNELHKLTENLDPKEEFLNNALFNAQTRMKRRFFIIMSKELNEKPEFKDKITPYINFAKQLEDEEILNNKAFTRGI